METFIETTYYISAFSLIAGVSVFLGVRLIWLTLDKVLGLLNFSKVLIQYSVNKGKCNECKTNKVYYPKLQEKWERESEEVKSRKERLGKQKAKK